MATPPEDVPEGKPDSDPVEIEDVPINDPQELDDWMEKGRGPDDAEQR